MYKSDLEAVAEHNLFTDFCSTFELKRGKCVDEEESDIVGEFKVSNDHDSNLSHMYIDRIYFILIYPMKVIFSQISTTLNRNTSDIVLMPECIFDERSNVQFSQNDNINSEWYGQTSVYLHVPDMADFGCK